MLSKTTLDTIKGYIPEENINCREEHAYTEVYNVKAYYGVDKVKKPCAESNAVNGNKDEVDGKRNDKVDKSRD